MDAHRAQARAVALSVSERWTLVLGADGLIAVVHRCLDESRGLGRFEGVSGDNEVFVCKCGQRLFLQREAE